MRSACRAMLAVGLAGLLAGPALAQPGGGARLARPTYWGNTVLQNKSVQEELKLTADQIDKIREISHSVYEKHREELDALEEKLGGEKDRKKREPVNQMRLRINEEARKGQEEILNPQQKKRLKEITLQQRGTGAFSEEEVQNALNLTADQKDKIKTIENDFHKQWREILPPDAFRNRAELPERFKKMDALRKESMDKILVILTDNQKKKYKEMAGAPFELKIERAAQPGRRPAPGQEKDPNKR